MVDEARKLDRIGKEVRDPFNPLRKNRSHSTEYYKKACSTCEKIYGDESIKMAGLLLELGKPSI